MDGNNRWAKAGFLPKKLGHKKGAEAAERAIRLCKKYGVNYLTLYTFSSENWSRPQEEIRDLMDLLRNYLRNEVPKIVEGGARLRFIGQRAKLPQDIQELMAKIEDASVNNKFVLTIALSYGSRDELAEAAKSMALQALAKGDVEGLYLADFLETKDIPDPDLLIRTGGDIRVSNFLLWQLAYTELYFINTFWPDFDEQHLLDAFAHFNRVERRFGGRNE